MVLEETKQPTLTVERRKQYPQLQLSAELNKELANSYIAEDTVHMELTHY